jgi:hypothetical protein
MSSRTTMSEADVRFVDTLRADLQRQLGPGLEVSHMGFRQIGPGIIEAIALVRADRGVDVLFRASGETIVEAYGRLLTDGHPERVPHGYMAIVEPGALQR